MKVNFNVLNQKSAPALYESSLANRPTAGYMGRLFIDTDIPSTGIYWDSGTVWYKIASASIAETQSLNDVCVIGNNTVTLGTYIYGRSTYGQKSGAAIPVEPNYALTIGSGDGVNDKSLYVAFNSILNGLVNVIGGNTASNPGLKVSGGWFTGGSATTTKPQLLVEPDGTTTTAWSTLGTGIGINAATGFTGNLIDAQLAGVSKFSVSSAGGCMAVNVTIGTGATASAIILRNGSDGFLDVVGGSNLNGFSLAFSGSATRKLYVDNSGNLTITGGIAIGSGGYTTTGNTAINGLNTAFYSNGQGTAGYEGGIQFRSGSTGLKSAIQPNAGKLDFYTNGLNTSFTGAMVRMTIDTSGNVGIGTTTPNSSAKLVISSTNSGFLPPCMTTVQKIAITSPAAGLMVYDTTLNKLCVFTTAWETITSI